MTFFINNFHEYEDERMFAERSAAHYKYSSDK
jgi:hypothetical protein